MFHASVALALPTKNILIFGDSLSAGYGIAREQGWPALLGQKLAAGKLPYAVTNVSISGETTAGGRTRLAAALRQHQPAVVIIALGANDGLRGLPLAAMRSNLVQMIRTARKQKVKVLLIGMQLPPNYGTDYTAGFARTFSEIAKQEKVPLLPFLLAPIAAQRDAFQADNLHPTANAQAALLGHVWPALLPLLR